MTQNIVGMGNSMYFWKEIYWQRKDYVSVPRLYSLDIQQDCFVSVNDQR